jgi:hypothetical protein
MKSLLIAFILAAFAFFLLPTITRAADTPTPTPTLSPQCIGETCGCDNQICCGTTLNSKPDTTPLLPEQQDQGDKGPCIPFTDWCMWTIFDKIGGMVSAIFSPFKSDDPAAKSFDASMGTCKAGFRRELVSDKDENLSCVCKDNHNVDEIANTYCKEYVVPATTKGGTTKGDLANSPEGLACSKCFHEGNYWSSLGCIEISSFQNFIQKNVFGWGIGLAGILAFGCMIYSAVQIQLSGGNAERVKKSQEMLTSCIMGLMVIIFSVFILRLIGVTILQIPGFS